VNGNAHTSISVVDFRATRSLTRLWAVCRHPGSDLYLSIKTWGPLPEKRDSLMPKPLNP
jgi:hypothetical protein